MSHRSRPLRTLALALLAAGAAGLGLTACHRPGGAIMAYTGGSQTYYSTETLPKTVRLIDVRSAEVVFEMDIPTGKQLSLDFVADDGDDPVHSPDLMRYQIFDLGTTTGKLTNAMSVPSAGSRLIEVELREGIEYVSASPDRGLRTDEMIDRPDWWTPEGGELPKDDTGLGIYDD